MDLGKMHILIKLLVQFLMKVFDKRNTDGKVD